MSNYHHRLDNWPRDIVNDAGGQWHKWPKSLVIPPNLAPNKEMLKVGPAQLQIYRSSEPLKSIFIYTKRCGKLKATSKN